MDEEIGGGGASGEQVFDLTALEKQDASKHLFSQVDWQDYLRAGAFLSQSEYQLLERAQDNIDFAMGNATSARALANLLMKLADKCTSSVPVQQYVFTRVEEILCVQQGSDLKTRAALFTVDGSNVQDGPFLRAIRQSDSYIQESASIGLATLLTVCDGEAGSLITWICENLSSSVSNGFEVAIPALTVLMRRQEYRKPFANKGGIGLVANVLQTIGANGSAQTQYELCFILWALSMDDNSDIPAFLSGGTINLLTDLLAAAPSRKVVRMAVATLLNLARNEDEAVLTEMLTGGLTRILETMIHANAHKQAGDPEVENDVRGLFEVLMKNYREFSSYDRWVVEIHSGSLRWGIVHTEKFWRENARLVEENEFELLKALIHHLHSDDETVLAVALYDLGEFTRFYPNGRGVVKSLGGKDIAMEMIGHPSLDIQRHALQCISKIMVTNWEFMK